METLKERWHRWYMNRREAHLALCRAWKERNPERARDLNREADYRYKTKVLRQERCITCGRRFPWTQDRENKLRNRGTRVVVSRQCGKVAAQRERADDGRAPRPTRADRQPQARRRQPAKDRRRRA